MRMKVVERLKSSPLWFVLPSMAIALAIGTTVAGYNPLVFDPSLYRTQSALASELTGVDADALESKSPKNVGGGGSTGAMADGTWTGYAACGEGNADNWSPYYVAVTIEVKDNKVTAITNIAGTSSAGEGSAPLSWDAAQNQEYLDRAVNGRGATGVLAQMESQLAEAGAVSGIDAVSGATYSSTAIYNAYVDATKRASGEVSAPEVSAQAASGIDTSRAVDAGADVLAAELADGSWTGYAACGAGNDGGWQPYYVSVTVQVSGGKVAGIIDIAGSATGDEGDAPLAWDASQNQKYLEWAINGREGNAGVKTQMDLQISSASSVTGIDTVSGATYSSEAIYRAYAAALAKSAAAAGADASAKPAAGDNEGSQHVSSSRRVADQGEDMPVGSLADGSWTGFSACGNGSDNEWPPYYVSVTVKVAGGKVVGITEVAGSATGDEGDAPLAWDASQNQKYLEWASSGREGQAGVKDQINAQVKATGSVVGVDTVSGATYSSEAIYRAYVAALVKSAAAGGAEVSDYAADSASGGSSSSPGQEGDSSSAPPLIEDVDEGDAQEIAESSLADGVWMGYATCGAGNDDGWSPYYVAVGVRVSDGKAMGITRIFGSASGEDGDVLLAWNESENQKYLGWAASGRTRGGVSYVGVADQINAALAAGASASSVDAVSGATFSSSAIFKAYYAALRKSAVAGGGVIEEPADYSDRPGDSGDSDEPGNQSGSDGGQDPGDSGASSGNGDSQGAGDSGSVGDASATNDSNDSGGGETGGLEAGDAGETGDSSGDAAETGGDSGDAGDSSGDSGDAGDSSGNTPAPSMVDGTYVGYGWCEDPDYLDGWNPYFVMVSIRVANGSIADISEITGDAHGQVDPDFVFESENVPYFNRALNGFRKYVGLKDQLAQKLAEGSAISGIDTVSGATFSSRAILDAFVDAAQDAEATTLQ